MSESTGPLHHLAGAPQRLRVALIKDGETFPHLCAPWTLRMGNLAREMASRGHDVTWYASTFMHNEKEFYSLEETVEELDEGYRMHLLFAGGYRKNISWARWRHHARLARQLYTALHTAPSLDAVVCCIPILEVAAACQLFCRKRGIPLILDIRDPWPETFVSAAPKALRPLVRLALWPYFLGASRLFAQADSVIAVSAGFLSWAQALGRRAPRRCGWDRVVYHGAHSVKDRIEPDPVLPTAGLRSVYLGTFASIYDFEPIARLAEAQAASGDDHHFFLVGHGGDSFARWKERLGSLPNVTFTGWIPREKAYALAQTCHLGWLPLGHDTDQFLPNKPFEYAALGLAVATSSQGEAGRLVAEQGLGFCYGRLSADELLAEIRQLRPGVERFDKWRARAPLFHAQMGDARVCASQYADHVERLVALHRRPRVKALSDQTTSL